MLIGNRYADNKLYRGIRHYDHLPLTSGDLHEYADILQMKNALFMNNIVGSGTLNEPKCTISATGISLSSPSIVMIDGDIALIQSDVPSPLVSKSEIESAGYADGVVCIVGWYQSLTASSTLRSFGGVNNSILENDIIDTDLDIQVSTRYQLRWDTVIIDYDTYRENQGFQFSLPNRDDTGALTSDTSLINVGVLNDSIRVATRPASMTYAVSDLYIVPIIRYKYTDSIISEATAYPSRSISGNANFLESKSEPVGVQKTGTIWYNPENQKLKFYIEGIGFVSAASDLTMMQLSNTITVQHANSTTTDVKYNIGIDSFTEGDILQVIYQGLVLTEGENYSVNVAAKTITLLNFITEVGEQMTFIVTKLVDTTAVNNITNEFSAHVSTSGNESQRGHVYLSDDSSPVLDNKSGIAVTPKALYEASTIVDDTTGIRYRIKVNNKEIYLEEIIV